MDEIKWHLVRFAQHDPQSGLTLLWHGNAEIHGVMGDGQRVTGWEIESPHAPDLLDAMDSVQKHIELQYFPKG